MHIIFFCGADLSCIGFALQFSFFHYREIVASCPKTRTKNKHTQNNVQFLVTFTKLRKATISFVISVYSSVCRSVRLSVRLLAWNKCFPTGRILIKFHIRVISQNLSRKFKFH